MQLKKINLEIQWKDLSGNLKKKIFPLTINYYNNYNDYYIYDDQNRLIGENKNKVNSYITEYSYYP